MNTAYKVRGRLNQDAERNGRNMESARKRYSMKDKEEASKKEGEQAETHKGRNEKKQKTQTRKKRKQRKT